MFNKLTVSSLMLQLFSPGCIMQIPPCWIWPAILCKSWRYKGIVFVFRQIRYLCRALWTLDLLAYLYLVTGSGGVIGIYVGCSDLSVALCSIPVHKLSVICFVILLLTYFLIMHNVHYLFMYSWCGASNYNFWLPDHSICKRSYSYLQISIQIWFWFCVNTAHTKIVKFHELHLQITAFYW